MFFLNALTPLARSRAQPSFRLPRPSGGKGDSRKEIPDHLMRGFPFMLQRPIGLLEGILVGTGDAAPIEVAVVHL